VLHERWPSGYAPLRKDVSKDGRPPLADHRFVPFEVHGEGVYQLPVGPINAGIIEPGHFRFSAIGERVLHLDPRLFFTHRGLEKLVEGQSFERALPIVERACGVCTVTHGLAYSRAVELLTKTTPPPRAEWARVILGELERTYNHVGDLGNICAGIGFQPGVARLGMLKERLVRLNDALTGHRYLTGIVAPGGLAADLDADVVAALPAILAEIAAELASSIRSIIRSEGVMDRFHGTGVVSEAVATTLGAVGVAARATGMALDLRRDQPYGAYTEIAVEPVTAHGGDVAARFHVRAQEAHESIRLIGEAQRRLPHGPCRVPLAQAAIAGDSCVTGVEGPRGASWIWLRAGKDGTVDRLRLRSASFANWPVVAAAVPGNLVPDFPLINKSFELCYACTDR
jgi:Ni,Fe-hydrogenase III large subunit